MHTSVFMSCLSRYEEEKKTSACVESGTHVLESAQEDKLTQTRTSTMMSLRLTWNYVTISLSANKYKYMSATFQQNKVERKGQCGLTFQVYSYIVTKLHEIAWLICISLIGL